MPNYPQILPIKEKSLEQMDIITQFKENTSLVSSVVHSVKTIQQALETAVSICKATATSDCLTSSGNELPAPQGVADKHKTLAAHDLDAPAFKILEELCRQDDITLVTDTLRNHGNGINVGVTFADFGIAETGTLVINSDSEEKRLITMISDVHVAVLPVSKIRETALGMVDELESLTSKPSSYTAFITGPSRTADIERVLAIGVHGPLALHIVLLENQNPTQEPDTPRS
jgi:L-lactate dehydrogenase complex protein LldG